MKKSLILTLTVMAFVAAAVYAGPGYNWSTGSGANWVTPDTSNIQQGQALVITSTTPYPTISTSSTTPVGLGVFTIAQINALVPTMKGQIVFCSNCTVSPVCVSTAAVIQSFAAIASTSTTNLPPVCQ